MISVVIISKNEEEVIADCLDSVKDIADEIIVIDDSSDKTPEIAERFRANIVKNPFRDFSAQRNTALDLVKGDWVFYIDADERITPAFIKEFKRKIENCPEDLSGFFIRRKTFYLGKDWNFTDKVERVFKKNKIRAWKGIVHETPEVDGRLGVIEEPILHFTHRNLSQMLQKTNKWSEYEAKLRFDTKHPKMNIWRFIRVIATGFFKSYVKERGIRNGTPGLIEGIYQAFSMFVTYSKLWEMQEKK